MTITAFPAAADTETEDKNLMERVNGGDEQAFALLVQRYHALVFNYAYSHLLDYELAQDVTQMVWVKLYQFLPTLQLNSPTAKPWLMQVVRNRCIDAQRNRQVARKVISFTALESAISITEDPNGEGDLTLDTLLPGTGQSPEEALERQDMYQRLHEAINTLPPKFRVIVSLRFVEGLKFSEIGEAMGIPETTAKTYCQRAIARLRDLLHANVALYYSMPM